MINIFISRPTWVEKEFRDGLEGFLSFLETHDLKPRTIGSTDYPTEVPMDEVITLMGECEGAIILGYPQIHVIKSKIKDSEKDDYPLPTEWNHIEATLAYAKNMPLLIIHHKGIDKGIFEHGATSKFIYETDFTKANWFLSENISKALIRWKALITQLHDKKSDFTKTVPTPLKPSPARLNESVEAVLVHLFVSSASGQRTSAAIRNKLNYPAQATTYCLKKLREEKMIIYVGDLMSGYYYNLTDKGREYVMTNKLITF